MNDLMNIHLLPLKNYPVVDVVLFSKLHLIIMAVAGAILCFGIIGASGLLSPVYPQAAGYCMSALATASFAFCIGSAVRKYLAAKELRNQYSAQRLNTHNKEQSVQSLANVNLKTINLTKDQEKIRDKCGGLDVITMVFERLPVKDLATVARVCSLWRMVSHQDLLWKPRFEKIFGVISPEVTASPEAHPSFKHQFAKKCLSAYKERQTPAATHAEKLLKIQGM